MQLALLVCSLSKQTSASGTFSMSSLGWFLRLASTHAVKSTLYNCPPTADLCRYAATFSNNWQLVKFDLCESLENARMLSVQLSVKWHRPINWLKPQKSFVAPNSEQFSICVRCTVWIFNEQIHPTATPPRPHPPTSSPATANGRKYISSYFWLHSFQFFFVGF